MNKYLNKKLLCIFLLLVFPLIGYAQIEIPTEKIHPPYPDIWGYDLSEYPAMKWNGSDVRGFKAPDGDIWFIISTFYQIEDPRQNLQKRKYLNQKYVLIKFFKNETIEISKDERGKLISTLSKNSLESMFHKNITFQDGTKISVNFIPGGRFCFIPDFIRSYLLKEDLEGNKKSYSILAAFPQVKMRKDDSSCDVETGHFFYQKIYFLSHYLIDLGDDTFITYSPGSNLILRFDKNLKTKFQPMGRIMENEINRNFFIEEFETIGTIQQNRRLKEGPAYQAVHDELLVYLKEKYNSLSN